MELTPQVIEFYKDAATNPSKHNLAMRPFSECFEPSETITAMHHLFDAYQANENRNMPKIIIYMLLEEFHGAVQGKDAEGSGGYFLKFKPKENG